ncbi:MAG: hypothetical protein IKC40_00125, partial [Oscillospiraceae bacterium]|nr:hypothetical protein [Oscillospiraceae bacterium]
AERLKELEENLLDGSPVLLSFFGNLHGSETRTGHSVVGYALEYGEYHLNYTYTGRVKLYDNNLPEHLHGNLYLYFNPENASWYIPFYKLDSLTGATLCQTMDDINLINSGGMLGNTEYTGAKDFIAILSTNQLATEHSVSQITFSDDSWTESSEVTAEIQEFPAFLGTSITDGAYNYTLSDAESGYVLASTGAEHYDLALNYEDCLLVADAEAASQAVFHPSGYLEIAGDNTSYTLEMIFNEGYYTGSWYDFTVSGNADTVSLQKTEDGYVLTSDNLKNITVTAKNDDVQANLTFSTDADSVLLQEVDENTIAAKIDTDEDGVYETKLSTESEPSVYGDLNGDGSVNALDAALILQYAAYSGAGGELSFEAFLQAS